MTLINIRIFFTMQMFVIGLVLLAGCISASVIAVTLYLVNHLYTPPRSIFKLFNQHLFDIAILKLLVPLALVEVMYLLSKVLIPARFGSGRSLRFEFAFLIASIDFMTTYSIVASKSSGSLTSFMIVSLSSSISMYLVFYAVSLRLFSQTV